MSGAELKVLFKAVKDTSVAKVIDNIKGEVRSLNPVMSAISKKMGGDIFSGMSESFKKLNPELMKFGANASKEIAKGFKSYGMASLPQMLSRNGPALPSLPSFLQNPDFFKKQEATNNFPIIKAFAERLGVSVGALGRLGATGLAIAGAFVALKKTIQETAAAFENARQGYAKSLMSGLNLQFTTKRGAIADVLGVDETQIFRFGAALAYLTPRLAWATDQIAKTTVPLTGVGWEFKILETNLRAIWSQIASALAPAMGAFLQNLNKFLESLGKMHIFEALGIVINKMAITISNLIGVWEITVSAFSLGMKAIAAAIALAIVEINNSIAKSFIGKKLGFTEQNGQPIKDDFTASYQSFKDLVKTVWDNRNGSKLDSLPAPVGQMKQLPAGAFEKMGLIIGGGMGDKALELQRRTATATEKIYQTLSSQNKQKSGFYMGRSQFVNGY